jgi:hypothetical protein
MVSVDKPSRDTIPLMHSGKICKLFLYSDKKVRYVLKRGTMNVSIHSGQKMLSSLRRTTGILCMFERNNKNRTGKFLKLNKPKNEHT